ncbi:reverse transcriptase family protein [Caballeronia sp. GACF4]|uniref:reverse transcriptase family protein n=1 Tax=Caballeronia sp. GACF4 TaxID=2921763 RepID=UPI002027DDCA|nr:reverse transcriptase family protein [Caballeronia sp. GACF4]
MPTKNLTHRREKAAGRARLRKNQSARYPIEHSPLWQLSSIHRLAALLDVSAQTIDAVCTAPTYNRFDDHFKPGKEPRHIQEPTEATLKIHYRLAKLFDSIERPAFLHSATKTRSHVTNARAHLTSGGAVIAMDIRKFFESTTYHHVKAFFHRNLGCSHDVARLLATVCTVDGHLPTGSCISPLLSYFTHRKMFTEIETKCVARSVVMTLYVDDLTLSGIHATKAMLYEIKKLIVRHGLRTKPSKDAVVRPGKSAIITGAVRDGDQLRLRNKHHDAIVKIQDQIAVGKHPSLDQLRGRVASARAVEPRAAERLEARLKQLQSHQARSGCTDSGS